MSRHWLTTSTRFLFSSAAATRSLSDSCLLTGEDKDESQLWACRRAPASGVQYGPVSRTCVLRGVCPRGDLNIHLEPRRKRAEKAHPETEPNQRGHAAVRDGWREAHCDQVVLVVDLDEVWAEGEGGGRRSANELGASERSRGPSARMSKLSTGASVARTLLDDIELLQRQRVLRVVDATQQIYGMGKEGRNAHVKRKPRQPRWSSPPRCTSSSASPCG